MNATATISATQPVLRAANVCKTYRMGRVEVPVLRGVSIEVAEGEWVAILGASGSGKSTLMHILGGLDRPDRGGSGGSSGGVAPSVWFRDRELTGMTEGEIDRYRNESVGFVFQFYHLLPELTVVENVLLPTMRKFGKLGFLRRRGELMQQAGTLLESFGLGHRLRHRPSELSGGERQRTAIARALINNPPVLLADEPTGNLDHKTGATILDAIAGTRSGAKPGQSGRPRTVVMVTHDLEVAARADRVVTLVDGVVTGESAGREVGAA